MNQPRYVLNYRVRFRMSSTTHVQPCYTREELDLYARIMQDDCTITDVLMIDKAKIVRGTTRLK